ncbi:hypothetical protein [Nitrospirillum amazonense]|nr:hypothetical protein [Nitrospirillum amazonense]
MTTAGTPRAKKKIVGDTATPPVPSLQVVESMTSTAGVSKAKKARTGSLAVSAVQAAPAKDAKAKRPASLGGAKIIVDSKVTTQAPAINQPQASPSATPTNATKRVRKAKAPKRDNPLAIPPATGASNPPLGETAPEIPEARRSAQRRSRSSDADSAASSSAFQNQQIRNLWNNFRRVDDFANGLVLEVTQLRHQLEATEKSRVSESRKVRELQSELAVLRERPDTAELNRALTETESWRQNYQMLTHQFGQVTAQLEELRHAAAELERLQGNQAKLEQAQQMLARAADGLAPLGLANNLQKWHDADGGNRFGKEAWAFYRVSAASLTCPSLLNIDLQLQRLVPFYESSGLSGVVEKVAPIGDSYQCTGWATTRMVPNIASLVAVFDDSGCLGYNYPSLCRQDVASALSGCNPDCGFQITFLRQNKGPLRVYLIVLLEGQAPFALLLPFMA